MLSETIHFNVTYGYEQATNEEFENALKMANIYKTIIEDKDLFPLGIDTQVGERGTKLSGG